MKNYYETTRLILSELTLSDSTFILELVNTPEWIKFIGDRNIKSEEDAIKYIRKIIDSPTISYWIVRTRDQQSSIGIITLIRRDYLEHDDIGFAFLKKYTKRGYAFEATQVILNDFLNDPFHSAILAITVKENVDSINLLEKLGFQFSSEVDFEKDHLLVYSLSMASSA